MTKLEPPKSNAFDRAHMMLRGALGFIPFFGQAIEKAFVEHFPSPKARKTALWQQQVSEQVTGLADGRVILAFVRFQRGGKFWVSGSDNVSSIVDLNMDLFQVNLMTLFDPNYIVVHPVGDCPAFTVTEVGPNLVRLKCSEPLKQYSIRIDGRPPRL